MLEKSKPNLVLINKEAYKEFEVGEILGGFVGYLQHSKPAKGLNNSTGMMANIFGENGEDADVITALNLTKFQNLPVKITIWSLKDKNGKLLKYKENGEDKFPTICQFIGRIHRPTSSISGLTARFFGEMGGNADAVNELNKTEFTNSLVYVQVQLAEENALLSEIVTVEPNLTESSAKLTPKELKALEKQQQKFEDADNILVMQNFYGNLKVLEKLGNVDDFDSWIKKQPCIISNKREVVAYKIIKSKPYDTVPIARNLVEKLDNGTIAEENPKITHIQSFLTQWNKQLINDYAREKLKDKLGIPQEYYLDPKMVYQWSIDNEVNKLIPLHYTSFIK